MVTAVREETLSSHVPMHEIFKVKFKGLVSVLAGQNIAPETATIYLSTSSLSGVAYLASEKCSSVH